MHLNAFIRLKTPENDYKFKTSKWGKKLHTNIKKIISIIAK